MTELEALRMARDGRARFTIDRLLTDLGSGPHPLWKIEDVGRKPCEPYIAHGGFLITSESVVRSVLTSRGKQRLYILEQQEVAA